MFVRRTLAALTIGAVLAGGTAHAAAADVPEGMTPAAQRALDIRSEALNTRYGSAASTLPPEALDALVARSEGMNDHARTLRAAAPAASASFAWDDFGVGMAAAFGLVLLLGGLAFAVRTGLRKQVRIPS